MTFTNEREKNWKKLFFIVYLSTYLSMHPFVWSATLRTLTFQDFNCGCRCWSLTWRFIFILFSFYLCCAFFQRFKIHRDMSRMISRENIGKKECNICSLAFAQIDEKQIQFCLIFLLKNLQIRAWYRLYIFILCNSSQYFLRILLLSASNYAIATILYKIMITFGLIRVCCARFSLKWRFEGIRSHYNCVCSWPLKWLSDISWYSFAVAFDMLVSFCLVCLVFMHWRQIAIDIIAVHSIVHALCI